MDVMDSPETGPCAHIYRVATPYLDIRKNDLHTRIAYGFAARLLRAEGGDAAIVLPAVTLHDIGWKSIPAEQHLKAFGPGENDMTLNRIHEVEGARIARRILTEADFELARLEEIVAIIEGHDSRLSPLSLNDALVKDADKLWRFSREALQIDPVRFQVDPAAHLKWLGQRIPEWFFTTTARTIAREQYRLRADSLGMALEPEEPS